MSTERDVHERIDEAADAVGSVWPLHSFVTANPLAGFEDQPFHEAVTEAEQVLGGEGYPGADVFARAWEDGRIDRETLEAELDAHGYDTDPEAALDRLAAAESSEVPETGVTPSDKVDAIMTKWLSAFLDQGRAEWSMPDREAGFYEAFRTVAPHDSFLPDRNAMADLPDGPVAAIRGCLEGYPAEEWTDIFEFHLASLPGWTGFIKRRIADDGPWQSACPITLAEYLAVRLLLVDQFGAPVAPDDEADGIPGNGSGQTAENETGETAGAAVDGEAGATGQDRTRLPLPEVWLAAWEESYREELVESVTDASASRATTTDGARPDAQLVFCIDTRSEIIRRHIEATGEYETHGYAGFFGIPMRHSRHDSEVTVDACPPILDAEHRIADRPAGPGEKRAAYDRWHGAVETYRSAIHSLKSNVATAFSFVESAGAGYGVALAARTLLPARVHDLVDALDERVPDDHEFVEPTLEHDPGTDHDLPVGLTLDQKVEYAATAFELMGWEQFARVVVFAGHASETANNPFDSSLDCGACAGNPGGPSARVLAAICNDEAVREELAARGIEIPADTVFVAGEHNTTTDEVELYAGDVPESHAGDVEELRADLATARAGATAERADDMGARTDSGVRETERRATDWAETRPEWGLAGNAGFVVGPRELTEHVDLDGRSFLHSYDWQTDPDGQALEAIMAGPMVVTQWINTQYYFATVDNAVYGSGSKVTHNPVGNVGVYQGNGGDLMGGLPLQSLMSADEVPYHQPLRLSTVIHAPVERVSEVLADLDQLRTLLDNDWLSLTVVDPQQDHEAFQYDRELNWTADSAGQVATSEQRVSSSVADD